MAFEQDFRSFITAALSLLPSEFLAHVTCGHILVLIEMFHQKSAKQLRLVPYFVVFFIRYRDVFYSTSNM